MTSGSLITPGASGVISKAMLARGLYVVAALVSVGVANFAPFSAYSLNILMQASTYAVAVLGLTIVLGYTGQINLAQAAFFSLGAYSVALGTTEFGLVFFPALAIGIILACVAGGALGLTSLRLGGHYLAMVTISFQTMLSLVLINWVSLTHGPDGVLNILRPTLLAGYFTDSGHYLALCTAVLYLVGYLVWRLRRTKLGRAMQAVRDNELAAGVVGVDTYRTKVVAFDTIPPAPDLLRAGKVQLLVGQKYFGWGEESVRLLKAIVDGHPPPQVLNYSGIDVVTRDNLDAYLEKWKRWERGGEATDEHG